MSSLIKGSSFFHWLYRRFKRKTGKSLRLNIFARKKYYLRINICW